MRILLTGGIGCGKSTVANIFKQINIPVWHVDDENRKAMKEQYVQEKYNEVFGTNCFDENDRFKRELLPMFYQEVEKKNAIEKFMEKILHDNFSKWYKEQKSPYVIIECAQGIELDIHKNYDKIIVVYCPANVRLERVMKRDIKTEKEIKQIMESQLSESERLFYADYVIDNETLYDYKNLEVAVKEIHKRILYEK